MTSRFEKNKNITQLFRTFPVSATGIELLTNLGNRLFKYRGFTPYPIVVLFVLFANPTPLSFLQGMMLMLIGEGIRIWGVAYLGPDTRKYEIGASKLVTCGPYRWVRNPIYLGNLCIYSGVTIIARIYMPYFLLFIWLYFGLQCYWIMKEEERKLTSLFGERYLEFMREVPRFFPRFLPFPVQEQLRPELKIALRTEKSTFLSHLAVLLILGIRMYFN